MKNFLIAIMLFALLLPAVTGFAQKETPPEGGAPKDFQLPAKETFTLENGMGVTLVPYGNMPLTTIRVVLRVGNLNEAANQTWLADMTGELLKEGTADMSAEQIADKAAGMGGAVNISVGMDQSWVGSDVLSEFTPDMVKLLAKIIREPAFPQSSFERLKKDFQRNLSIQKSQPQNLAREKFLSVLYPEHPYGRMFPTPEMLNGYTLEDVRQFYQNNFGGGRAHIYIVGKYNAGKVKDAVVGAFDSWPQGPEILKKVPQPETQRKIYLIDRPGAPQSTVYIGQPVLYPSQDDFIAMQVTNTLLGGYFSSRITSNIREDKGYTYSPHSSLSTRYHDAFWAEVADVSTDVTGASLKEIFYEIHRLQDEAPPEKELKAVQNYMAGTFVLQNSSRSGIIGQLAYIDLHELPDNYLNNYVQNVYKVTPEMVQQMAKQYLGDKSMVIVVVGDVDKIKKQVQPYGNVIL